MRKENEVAEYTDVIIDSPNPEALDQVLQSLGAVVVGIGEGGPIRQQGGWLVRVLGNVGFVKFACENQDYGMWVGEAEKGTSTT
jgi:hypothetical protein